MRTLVVGDVHGCSAELDALLSRAAADRVVLVGDLFTKGPEPRGVWARIADGGFEAVLGNHDQRLLDAAAGLRPTDHAAAACLEALPGEAVAWLEALPLFAAAGPFTVVHAGLHPSGHVDRTTRSMALTMRRWPADGPHWHEVYTGDQRVIFGHDAVRGLVRVERDGQPWLIGLDSGCVYGGALSGYLVETDELLQVPAARAYRPV